MQEIAAIKDFANETMESDCLGDMMSFMDKVKYPYFLNGNDTIRNCFKHAILRKLGRLWVMARATYGKEIYAFERSR